VIERFSGLPRRGGGLDSISMKLRFPVLLIAVVLASNVCASVWTPSLAQSPQDWLSPPGDLPHVTHGGPTYSLDTLFSALKIAPDEASAKAIEDRIWAMWITSGSDTCNLLMSRVKAATDDKDYDLAIKILDAVIALKPNYIEARNRRATVYYLKQDYGHALADIAAVLTREPRHFGALSGLGLIMQDLGDDKLALDAYRKALAIDPHLENLPDVVKTLSEKVEGRDI
jgi:tetratricopeptide (TPR) repeat protein